MSPAAAESHATSAGAAATLPFVLEPQGDDSAEALSARLSRDPNEIRALLLRHGAIRMRGFRIDTPQAFEQVARAIAPGLQSNYLGTSPRVALTPHVFTASELPPHYPIPQHAEMSFVPNPPSHLFFWAMRANDGFGGEPPLVALRRVARDLDAAVRDRFERLGLRIVRHYGGPEGGGKFNPFQLKRWDEMFGTTDRDEALAKAKSAGFQADWTPGGKLRITSTQPAFAAHPATGEVAWFNHSQVFHPAAASLEYRRIAQRPYALHDRIRYRALGLFAGLLAGVQGLLLTDDSRAMDCTYGDGTPITEDDLAAVVDAIWRSLVIEPWRTGDVVAIDNRLVAHGRMPYRGPRDIAVAWA